MKMKRMEMRDVSIGEYQFKIRPFGAKDALYIFGDVASILLPILGSVAVASDDKDAVEMEMFDGVDLDTESLTKALGRINGKALSKLVSELIMEHSNVSYRDPDRGSYQPVTEDEFDEIFCQYLAGVFSLCAEIIKLNFSGFFKDASTLFGGLIKVRRGGSLEEYGEFDNERVTDLEWVMYTLIRERVASMYELTYVYNLDEMLKLYDLIMMQRDIEYSRSQKERGGE